MSRMTDILKEGMRAKGYVIAPLEQYLMRKSNEPNDRAIDVNSPSQAGSCMRANFYMRKGVEHDGISPRTTRIFGNGDYVHIRLQEYLKECGILLMDEVPLINDEYHIQGHTDGFLLLGGGEIAILEIKSINDRGFQQLKDAIPEHKMQGMVYLFCAEERRKTLHLVFDNDKDFIASEKGREKYFADHYQHMKSGRKFSRKEKIANEVDLNMVSDDILFHADKPVNKIIFLYENKNTQDLKEYCVERNEDMLNRILSTYVVLNKSCKENIVPQRPSGATSKSCNFCRWCDYQNHCWIM